MVRVPLPGGVYPPIPTFFDAAGELDLATLAVHTSWLMEHPLPGVLALGSNGEAMHLDDGERVAVIRAARVALDAQPRETPAMLLAGTADQTTRGTIARCRAAAAAGAQVAVVLPPFAFPTQMTVAALRQHFEAVATASPSPLLIYNMPANTAGLDLSADLIIALAAHPNIIGVKDSSGQIAKLARIVAETEPGFAVLAGSGSFLIPTLSVGGTGAIAAVANVLPDVLAALYDLWQGRGGASSLAEAQMRERAAQMMQAQIIPINQFVTTTYGVAGLKTALTAIRGYGGDPRAPLLPLGEGERSAFMALHATLRAVGDVPRGTGETA
jgi:4-hydroxy-2-oxoglutarate aldolase